MAAWFPEMRMIELEICWETRRRHARAAFRSKVIALARSHMESWRPHFHGSVRPYRAHGGPRRRLRRRREIRPHVSLPSVPGAEVRAHPRSVPSAAPSRPPRPGRRAVDPGNADPSRDLSTDVQEALDAAPLDPARCAIRTARDTARRPDQGSTPPSPPAHRISTSPGGCWAARLPPLRRTAPGLLPAAARPSPVLFGGWLGALAPGAQAWTCVLQVQLKSCSGRQGHPIHRPGGSHGRPPSAATRAESRTAHEGKDSKH
ncbi:uncharacterized protein LOC120674523 [Panicum virgatum]|uniref:uncharacterized protein LOC120674523 n=1 Tax=Panicum virgatum TaxID=38727 RepID=UPI0019D5B3D3|nr:uncharacterized protein LOC120674523 [Panicum virgatum]